MSGHSKWATIKHKKGALDAKRGKIFTRLIKEITMAAKAGAVSYMFHKKGDILVAKSAAKEDDLMGLVLDAGADDLVDDGENWEVLTAPSAYEKVLEAVKKAGIEPVSASVTMIPELFH